MSFRTKLECLLKQAESACQVTNTLAYYKKSVNHEQKDFITLASGLNLTRDFSSTFTASFCKLDRFINVDIICLLTVK
jgi:hypothetical protein